MITSYLTTADQIGQALVDHFAYANGYDGNVIEKLQAEVDKPKLLNKYATGGSYAEVETIGNVVEMRTWLRGDTLIGVSKFTFMTLDEDIKSRVHLMSEDDDGMSIARLLMDDYKTVIESLFDDNEEECFEWMAGWYQLNNQLDELKAGGKSQILEVTNSAEGLTIKVGHRTSRLFSDRADIFARVGENRTLQVTHVLKYPKQQ